VGAVEGCKVTVVTMVSQIPEKPERTIDAYSKYVERFFYAKKYDADGLANLLLEKCRVEGEKPILMSVDDDSACLVDTIQDRLRDKFYYSHIQHQAGAIAGLMDKSKQKQLARECGFNVVEAWPVDCVDGKYTVPDGVKYPCYVKGRLSYHSAKQYQKKCNNKEALEKWLKVLAQNNPSPLLIEEFIEIEKEFGVIGYSDPQKVILPGIVELLDGGHGGHKGVSAFGRVNDFGLNEELKPQVEQLLKHIQLTGMFNIDFVEANGKWFFVELNVRYAAYGYAVCRAGVNLPAFQIYGMLSRDDSELPTQVKNGFCYVNEKVAFDDFINGYRSWKDYKNLNKKADCCLIRDKKDPQPFGCFKCSMYNSYLKSIIKRLIGRK
jgi:predicted ATP-grasp superfamily ATP-dependent carboligase